MTQAICGIATRSAMSPPAGKTDEEEKKRDDGFASFVEDLSGRFLTITERKREGSSLLDLLLRQAAKADPERGLSAAQRRLVQELQMAVGVQLTSSLTREAPVLQSAAPCIVIPSAEQKKLNPALPQRDLKALKELAAAVSKDSARSPGPASLSELVQLNKAARKGKKPAAWLCVPTNGQVWWVKGGGVAPEQLLAAIKALETDLAWMEAALHWSNYVVDHPSTSADAIAKSLAEISGITDRVKEFADALVNQRRCEEEGRPGMTLLRSAWNEAWSRGVGDDDVEVMLGFGFFWGGGKSVVQHLDVNSRAMAEAWAARYASDQSLEITAGVSRNEFLKGSLITICAMWQWALEKPNDKLERSVVVDGIVNKRHGLALLLTEQLLGQNTKVRTARGTQNGELEQILSISKIGFIVRQIGSFPDRLGAFNKKNLASPQVLQHLAKQQIAIRSFQPLIRGATTLENEPAWRLALISKVALFKFGGSLRGEPVSEHSAVVQIGLSDRAELCATSFLDEHPLRGVGHQVRDYLVTPPVAGTLSSKGQPPRDAHLWGKHWHERVQVAHAPWRPLDEPVIGLYCRAATKGTPALYAMLTELRHKNETFRTTIWEPFRALGKKA